MSQIQILTLPELAIAISQLPNCRHQLRNRIEIPLQAHRRENICAYERPSVIVFNRVGVLEPFDHVEWRWALSGEYNILI